MMSLMVLTEPPRAGMETGGDRMYQVFPRVLANWELTVLGVIAQIIPEGVLHSFRSGKMTDYDGKLSSKQVTSMMYEVLSLILNSII